MYGGYWSPGMYGYGVSLPFSLTLDSMYEPEHGG